MTNDAIAPSQFPPPPARCDADAAALGHIDARETITRRAALRTVAALSSLSMSLSVMLAGGAIVAIAPSAHASPRKHTRRDWYGAREQVRDFMQEMHAKHGLDPVWLKRVFAGVRRNEKVIRLITPKPRAQQPGWRSYRNQFTDSIRVQGGLQFWARHAESINAIQRRFGVPPEVLVAIIGVETIYGRNTGRFLVAEALATLAFDYPPRAVFFRGELEHFLLHAREVGIDPLSVRGSYAGAIGLPQFMPSSIRRFAVDFDGDTRIDLRRSGPDAVASVAHFLVRHGWQPGAPTHFTAILSKDSNPAPLLAKGVTPTFSAEDLAAHGVRSRPAAPAGTRFAMIALSNRDTAPDHVLGTHNFFVLTRYNRSSFYAMAVIELARRLRDRRDA